MWWKLISLISLAATLILSVIPFRTHAVGYDPASSDRPTWSFWVMIDSMYLTSTTVVLIGLIVLCALIAGRQIVRKQSRPTGV